MVGDLAFADQILGASELVGKDRRDQIFGLHAGELGRHLFPAAEARQRQCHAGNPAPARHEHRRVEQGLDQQRPNAGRMQVTLHLAQIEAVRGGQRQHDVVLGRRRLQLEIELGAKTLAQRQPPGAVDAAAIGRMDDQLHAADRVEEPLEDQRVASRQNPQRCIGRSQIFDELACGRLGGGDFFDQPAQRRFRRPGRPPDMPQSRRAAATPTATARRCGPAPRPARMEWSAPCPCASSTRTVPRSTRMMR